MKYRLHDCKNTGNAIPYLKNDEQKKLYQCMNKDHCAHKNHYGNIIFCNESPLFETITKKEVPK